MTVYPPHAMSERRSKCITDYMLTLYEIRRLEPCPQCFIKRIMKQKFGFSSRKINRIIYILANVKVCRKTGEVIPPIVKIDDFGRLVVA